MVVRRIDRKVKSNGRTFERFRVEWIGEIDYSRILFFCKIMEL